MDNNEAYERDEYSLAGIPEAAPKVKRREEEEEDNRWGGLVGTRLGGKVWGGVWGGKCGGGV